MTSEPGRSGPIDDEQPGTTDSAPPGGGPKRRTGRSFRKTGERIGGFLRSRFEAVRRDLAGALAGRKPLRHMGTIGLCAGLAVYLLSGVYLVSSGEVAVVTRFGRVVAAKVLPGLRWHVPWPVEMARRVDVARIRREGIGIMLLGHAKEVHPTEDIQLLSGDENLLSARAIVQYRVVDPVGYLFRVDYNEDPLLRAVLKAALTVIAGGMRVDALLTTGRTELQQQARTLAQGLLDSYGSGLEILSVDLQEISPPAEVAAAFRDVASAAEEKNKLINDAQGYANSLIPQARGEAEKRLSDAEGYRADVANRARGEAQRYLDTLAQYRRDAVEGGIQVTRYRLYVEVMENVLAKARKYIVETDSGGRVNLRFLEQATATDAVRP